MMELAIFIALFLPSFSIAMESGFDYQKLTNVKHLTSDDLYVFINSTLIRPVYFSSSESLEKYGQFYHELESSAKVLKNFKIEIGLVNCAQQSKQLSFCQTEAVHKDIYVFKDNEILLKLSLDTMFDLDSIVSNLLQLHFLNEIPILQSEKERMEFEKGSIGKKNIVFCQLKAMGTYEHRVFLEIVHEFMNEYTFVVCTTMDGPSGLSDYTAQKKIASADLWYLDCNRPDNRGPGCLSVKYRDAFNITKIRSFLKLVKNPVMFDIPTDGKRALYEDQAIHIAYLLYDATTYQAVSKEARRLSQIYHGTIGIVTVDTDRVSPNDIGLDLGEKQPPLLAFKLYNSPLSVMAHQFRQDNVDLFVKKHLRVIYKESIKERERRENVSVVGESEFDDSVLTPDDEVAESIRTMKTPPSTSRIRSLNDVSFAEETKKDQVTLVLFYMKFDPVSMTFLRSYAEASQEHSIEPNRPLTMIECFDWTDVCQKQNVTQYPVIRVYKPAGHYEYTGPIHGQSVLNFFRLHYIDNPLRLISEMQVDEFLSGSYPPDAQSVVEIIALGGVETKSEEAAVFDNVGHIVHGKYLLASVYDELAQSLCHKYSVEVPCLIILNKKDSIKPEHVYEGRFEANEILNFFNSFRVARFVEMTALNFPVYYQQKKPLIILFADREHNENEFTYIKNIAADDDFSDLLFTWMDVSTVDSLGSSVLNMYTATASVPTVAFVNLVEAEVYLYKQKSLDNSVLRQWLHDILSRILLPDHHLPKRGWKPIKSGYDFSKGPPKEILEDEEEFKMIVNEHGLGFDSDGQLLKGEGSDQQADDLKQERQRKRNAKNMKSPKMMMMDEGSSLVKDEL